MDNGGEFVTMKKYFLIYEISNYTSTPHTPQQNGIYEHRHYHLIKTSLTLLHDASLPLSYWPHAFATAAYFINCQPTLILNHKSPFKALFSTATKLLKTQKIWLLMLPTHKTPQHQQIPAQSNTISICGLFLNPKCIQMSWPTNPQSLLHPKIECFHFNTHIAHHIPFAHTSHCCQWPQELLLVSQHLQVTALILSL